MRECHLGSELICAQSELNAFDPAFFDEIEDLKYNHREACSLNET